MRYFILFYFGINIKGKTLNGSLSAKCNGFINNKEMTDEIKQEFNLISVTLTQIIEVNQIDYNEFIRK